MDFCENKVKPDGPIKCKKRPITKRRKMGGGREGRWHEGEGGGEGREETIKQKKDSCYWMLINC